MKAVSRGDGRSATAAAAYRACCVIECEREGRTHDYSRKRGLDIAGIVLPAGAPAWACDRARLWNAAELRERNGKRGGNAGAFKANAQVARDYLFTFPHELSREGRRRAAERIARHLAETHGTASDYAIHAPGRDGDVRNWHCHLLMTTRRLTSKGLGEKAREWDDLKSSRQLAKDLRALVARTLNEELAAEGKAALVRVEHLSFKDRGSPRAPTRHQGPARTHMLRKRQRRAREAWIAEQRQAQQAAQAKERATLEARQAEALARKTADLSRRAREESVRIRAELEAERRADAAPAGLRRVFLIVTGRFMREAFDRQARDGARVRLARERLAALHAGLKAEAEGFSAGQAQERAALAERHAGQDRQLAQAARSREGLDQTVERMGRASGNDRERQREGPEMTRRLSL